MKKIYRSNYWSPFMRDGVSKPRNSTLMRIFLNMDIAEHTGHGIPTIVNTYGADAFEITSSSIKCTIPFNEYVVSHMEGKNVGLNVGLNKTEKKVIELLILNANENVATLSEQIGVVTRTIERALKSLQEKGYIVRQGSKRDGCWIVKK